MGNIDRDVEERLQAQDRQFEDLNRRLIALELQPQEDGPLVLDGFTYLRRGSLSEIDANDQVQALANGSAVVIDVAFEYTENHTGWIFSADDHNKFGLSLQGDRLFLKVRDPSNQNTVEWTGPVMAPGKHHLLMSFDTIDNGRQRYAVVDGMDGGSWDDFRQKTLGFNRPAWYIGAIGGGTPFVGGIERAGIAFNHFLDLSDPANIALFRDAQGNLVDIGSSGQLATPGKPWEILCQGTRLETQTREFVLVGGGRRYYLADQNHPSYASAVKSLTYAQYLRDRWTETSIYAGDGQAILASPAGIASPAILSELSAAGARAARSGWTSYARSRAGTRIYKDEVRANADKAWFEQNCERVAARNIASVNCRAGFDTRDVGDPADTYILAVEIDGFRVVPGPLTDTKFARGGANGYRDSGGTQHPIGMSRLANIEVLDLGGQTGAYGTNNRDGWGFERNCGPCFLENVVIHGATDGLDAKADVIFTNVSVANCYRGVRIWSNVTGYDNGLSLLGPWTGSEMWLQDATAQFVPYAGLPVIPG